ncbi:centrosomal protein of 78 kDa [Frankliniella occidentalis]|uniref:Centrosomal protein of 78 kDa n=1 Tax=Frankliniella occidentalis TaxID=133901 RepID=A0A6J1TSC0_FRAOC|nr:centrosomal protein of 78 kDa [Frankliniella occidentalis]
MACSNFMARSPMKYRKKNCHVFQLCYTDLCNIHNTSMIFPIKAHLHKRILDFNGDRVKLDEWRPILKALSLDRSLHLIAIRSKNSCSKVLEHIDSETKCRSVVKRLPVLLTHFIFGKLVTSLSRCLHYNSHLKCLELDGLLLSGEYLQTLLSGLEKSLSLQHLSLHRCPLGDEGCHLVCNSLRNLPNILTVDMSGCNISCKGVHSIARTLQYQNLNRYGENWKQSLRYRTPDTDVMPGLRRVTLNHNPLIGDAGVTEIINVLRDDLWLKALDLQNVGLTNVGGMEIVNLLKVNKSLSVLDVHNNVHLDESVYESVMNMLASNNLGKPSEYHWIREDTLYFPRKPLYQSRDPSIAQRSIKCHDGANSEQRFYDGNAVRLTKSSIIPDTRGTQVQITKARSASAVISNKSNGRSLEHKNTPKALRRHQFNAKQKVTIPSNPMSNWEHINASGDGSYAHDIRAKLRELSSKLEEEKRRRLEAEKQNADLALRLETITQKHEGQILMDQGVVKEITEAFAAFNCFVAIFSKQGLPLRTENSSVQISDLVSPNSLSQSIQSDFESGVDEEPEDVKQFAALSLSQRNIQDWRVELNQATTSDSNDETSSTEIDQDSNSFNQKCKKVQKEVKTVGEDVNVDVPHGPIESPQSHLQNILNEIFQSDFPNLQLNDLLKTNPVSFITNRESNVPEKCLTTSPQIITPRKTDCDTEGDKGRGFSFCAGSNESLYMNAEQTNGNDAEDSNTSWVTESCYSDPSPTPTLTELNAN